MTAPVDALPLVRLITAHAYKAGASLVTTLFSDDETTLSRFKYAPDDSFDRASGWLYDGMAAAFPQRRGAAGGDRRRSFTAVGTGSAKTSPAPIGRARPPTSRRWN